MKAKRQASADAKSGKHARTAQSKGSATTKPTAVGSDAPVLAASSKQQRCLDLLGGRDGATLSELVAATDWQPHSVRGFLSGTVKKKLGHALLSTRDKNGIRRYRIDRTGRGR